MGWSIRLSLTIPLSEELLNTDQSVFEKRLSICLWSTLALRTALVSCLSNLKKSKYSYVIILSESFNILACMLTVDMTERKTAFKLLCLVLYKYMNDDLFWEN